MGLVHNALNKREVTVITPPDRLVEKGSLQAASNAPVEPQAGGNIAMTTEEQAALKKQKDLDAVSEALASGQGDMEAMLAIANRLENSDAEVRTAAREAAVHLGDTNIIPFLTMALYNIQDAREKVGVMDAIEYLKLPSAPEGYPDHPDPEMEAMMNNAAARAKFGRQFDRPQKSKQKPVSPPATEAPPGAQ